ncbi:MAG: hypothetical protein JST51_13035 [Armatimonadetes bacterium]|nr:hypothetical protein [Armatimonadota bacterium]
MDHADLLAENNRLMQQLLDFHAEQKGEAEKAKSDFDGRMAEMKSRRESEMNAKLAEIGASKEAAQGSEEDWEKRMKDAQQQTRERTEAILAKDRQYKDELLRILDEQTSLLRQISEKLG